MTVGASADLTTLTRSIRMVPTPTHPPCLSPSRCARPGALAAIALAVTLPIASCGDSAPNAPSANRGVPPSKDTSEHDHGHSGDHDHDHSDDAPNAPETPTSPDGPAPAAAEGPVLPKGLMLSRRPIGAVGVATARVGIRPGEPISVIGRIGGSKSPVVSNRAVFMIVDPEMKCCLETSDEDHCPRPWDYCCADRSQLAAATATIEICGRDGKPLPLSLEAEGTLKPLTLVAVTGVLESPDASGSFVIRARGIYIMPNDPLSERISAFRK